jgi:peptidase S24-like protein
MSSHSKGRPDEKGRSTHPRFQRGAGDDRATGEEDRLVQLLGAHSLRHLDPEDPAHAAFFDWLARELRESLSPAERRDLEARASEFAARIQTRMAAGRGELRLVGAAAPTRTPSVSGTVPEVLGRAAAERCAPCLELGVAAGVGRDLWDEPCTAWVELPEEIPQGRYVALTVSGESMEPLLHTGDTILVKIGPALARDAVVVARHPDDGYVVKRVSRIGRRTIQLASLNPSYGPVELPRRDDLVVGTVVLRWCAHGAVPPASQ